MLEDDSEENSQNACERSPGEIAGTSMSSFSADTVEMFGVGERVRKGAGNILRQGHGLVFGGTSGGKGDDNGCHPHNLLCPLADLGERMIDSLVS